MKQFLKEWGGFTLFLALILISRWLIWSPVTVDGHSMDPTLQDKERLIMLRTEHLKRFDIVVAGEVDQSGKEKLIVKRIIGLPGDTIRYENDQLFINDQATDEPYLTEYLALFKKDKLQETYSYDAYFQSLAKEAEAFTLDASGGANFTVTVPEDHYFLLGDDRLVSLDSRRTGGMPKDAIQGKVVFRIWPFNRLGTP